MSEKSSDGEFSDRLTPERYYQDIEQGEDSFLLKSDDEKMSSPNVIDSISAQIEGKAEIDGRVRSMSDTGAYGVGVDTSCHRQNRSSSVFLRSYFGLSNDSTSEETRTTFRSRSANDDDDDDIMMQLRVSQPASNFYPDSHFGTIRGVWKSDVVIKRLKEPIANEEIDVEEVKDNEDVFHGRRVKVREVHVRHFERDDYDWGEDQQMEVEDDFGSLSNTQRKRYSGSRRRRLNWTEELHSLFLEAVDECQPSPVPKAILEYMKKHGKGEADALTREQIASHLQKHRQKLQKDAENPAEPQSRSTSQKYFFPSLSSVDDDSKIDIEMDDATEESESEFLSQNNYEFR